MAFVSQNEIAALQTLFEATNGDEWTERCREGWNFTSSVVDPCSGAWFGITCNASDCSASACSIERFSLYECNMRGIMYNVSNIHCICLYGQVNFLLQ